MKTLCMCIGSIALLLTAAGCQRKSPERVQGSAREMSAPLSSAPLSYADVVDRVAPAVVTVRSSKRERVATQFPFANDPLFRQFFGIPPSGHAMQVQRSLGSGVVVRADGYILTNQHVVDGAQEIKIDLSDGRTFTAKVVGSDRPSDLAVLKINAGNLPVLSLANSDQVRVGDICLAVGNPLGVGETVTSGIISAKSRQTGVSSGSFEDFLQTDAPINQGNSGGALVNTAGELIGISSQILSTTGGNIGIGFAIPSNMARNVMDQLIGHGKVVRGHIGLQIQGVTSDLAASMGLKDVKGVLVSSVEPGGPGEKAGIKPGDVITAVDGAAMSDANSFRNRIASTAPGTAVTLSILRNGQAQQLHATLSETPEATSPGGESNAAKSSGDLGITIGPLTPDIADQLGVPKTTTGVVIMNVNPSGAGADAGLEQGDIIAQINRQPIRTPEDVKPALAKGRNGTPALLLINRGGRNMFVTVNPAR